MTRKFIAQRLLGTLAASTLALSTASTPAQTMLADQPVFSTLSVPGNLALALSVEFPTAISVAHIGDTYVAANTYLGYFDPEKCYLYNYHVTEANRYFYPSGDAAAHVCTSKWSGNFLNWATMQTIDPFRWALTGGYRSTDTADTTILEKAWGSNQGSDSNFPNRSLVGTAIVGQSTPLTWNSFNMRIRTIGAQMRFSRNGDVNDGNATLNFNPAEALANNRVYLLSVRVKVCDNSAGAGPLEANCVKQPNGNYKPNGLIHEYADRITFSAFGYLAFPDHPSTANFARGGGVLRARQKFVGPTKPVPGGLPVANSVTEWNGNTGVMEPNPDAADATATNAAFEPSVPVTSSGVMNYLNTFGKSAQGYKTYDPVSELYYAVLRYYRNLGNVPEWSDMAGATAAVKTTWLDNAPVITDWVDPIKYSCQKNFILGIGDTNTNGDFNVPGGTRSDEPAMPDLIKHDPMTPDAKVWTDRVGQLHGNNNALGTAGISNGSFLMAGMAYYANTTDLRTDVNMPGKQTMQTYWLDVLEFSSYAGNNQYYLAAKYGGFDVPDTYDPATRTTDIETSWWRTNTDPVVAPVTQSRPDNYFTANRPDQMVAGLTKTFASIASKLKSYTTSFSTALPQVASSGVASYATQFDAKLWSGELIASTTTFNTNTGQPALTEAWKFSTKLEAQASGSGWNSGRVIVSFNTNNKIGVPFRTANLSTGQVGLLNTSYVAGDDSSNYLNYLRGDRSNENVSDQDKTKAYRYRSGLIGDIVNSKARAVGPPSAPYGDAANPKYSEFKADNKDRKTMVYVGTNHGMLHGVDGSLTGTTAGREVFAYVPGAVYAGPNNTPGTNGLQSIGRADFVHYNLVDATPVVADVDFGRTGGSTGTPDWRTILVGSLGKGGRSVFALDVTDPAAMTTETIAASKVLWEFTDTDLGYTYGEPAVVKTRKWGWVVIFGSGYNNSDGKGYLFIVNAKTGELVTNGKISTGTSSPGLAHVQAFLLDLADGTADTVYAGDLLGNLWRFDLTSPTGAYPAPLHLAELGLPITSRPLVVVQPNTNRRYVTVGTGSLLHDSDINNTQAQRFFAVIDGQGSKFSEAADLPAAITFPIKPNNLKQLTDLTKKVTLDLTTEIGWYVDLGQLAGNGPGWRIISDATAFYGIVSFAPMLPSSSSACEPTGTSRIYAIDLGSGQSRLKDNVSYLDTTTTGVVTDRRFFSVDGQPRLLVCTDQGTCSSPPVTVNPNSGVKRLNWREIPLTQ